MPYQAELDELELDELDDVALDDVAELEPAELDVMPAPPNRNPPCADAIDPLPPVPPNRNPPFPVTLVLLDVPLLIGLDASLLIGLDSMLESELLLLEQGVSETNAPMKVGKYRYLQLPSQSLNGIQRKSSGMVDDVGLDALLETALD